MSGETDGPEDGFEHIASEQPSITEQIRSTVDESKAWLEAELAFQKVRLQDGGSRVKSISILMAAGAVLLLCSFITLLLGVFLTVAVYIGPVTALIAVPISYALLGYLAFSIAMSKIGGLKNMVRDNGGITGLKADEKVKDDAVPYENEGLTK